MLHWLWIRNNHYTPFVFITIIFIKIGGWKWAKIKNFLRIALRLKPSNRLRIFRLISYYPWFGLSFIRHDSSAYCSIFQLFIEVKFLWISWTYISRIGMVFWKGVLHNKQEIFFWGFLTHNLRKALRNSRLKSARKIRIFEAHFEKILRNLRLSKLTRLL